MTVTLLRRTGVTVTLFLAASVAAEQSAEPSAQALTQSEIAEQEAIEADSDGSLDDADNSIEISTEQRKFTLSADVRTGYTRADVEHRNNSDSVTDALRARWRVRSTFGLLPYLRGSVRAAGVCSTVECSPNFVLERHAPTNNGIADGDITLDEAFLHWYRRERFDLAVGRMQTRFVARGGVFAKSLDRNDSNNTNVTWTDGVHGTFRVRNGWTSHMIVQRNAAEGASNVRRGPLDFSAGAARNSYFVAFENLKRTKLFVQRAFDISYLPKTLLKEGSLSGPREDYYAFVLRSANRWPEKDDGPRLRIAAEAGYAPETQTRAAAGLAGSGDADGLAWNVVLSLMEFVPDHSIGLNYGRVGAGWLLSPQFRQNESLSEIRYQWRKTGNLAVDVRIRQRKELERLVLAERRRAEVDLFVRFTWGGQLR